MLRVCVDVGLLGSLEKLYIMFPVTVWDKFWGLALKKCDVTVNHCLTRSRCWIDISSQKVRFLLCFERVDICHIRPFQV